MNGILSRYRLRNTLIAGGLALVGAILVFAYVASYRKNVQHGAKLVTVFVAARDIPEGTDGASAAGAKYMRKESVLRRNVVDGAVSNPNQVSGLAAAQTIFTGEQITVRQFRSAAQQGVLANISGNLRAMTIPGDDNQLLSNVVKDGDHIDVLASIKYSLQGNGAGNGGGFNRVAARVILRNLLVLRAPSGASGRGINNSSNNGTSITLALTDTQAQKLLFAVANGDWWLALRPVAKPSDSPDSAATMQSILGDGLGPSQLGQLTNGFGRGSIGSGG